MFNHMNILTTHLVIEYYITPISYNVDHVFNLNTPPSKHFRLVNEKYRLFSIEFYVYFFFDIHFQSCITSTTISYGATCIGFRPLLI